MKLSWIGLLTVFATGPLLGVTTSSHAADFEAEASGWQVTLAPYGWATWLKGDQTVKGRTVELDVDPIQVIDHLEAIPFMGYAEARKGSFALYGDIVYAKLGLDADGVRSRSINPLITGSLSASLGLEFEQTVAEFGGTYEVARWPAAAGSFTSVEVLAGARYWHQELSIDLALNGTLDIRDLAISRGVAVARSGSVDWVDPVVGGIIRHQLAPGQQLMLRGDIGGFDVGSVPSWNVLAAYSFEIFSDDGVTYSGLVGYRALEVDYEQGSGRSKYEYDMLQHGPLSGLAISF